MRQQIENAGKGKGPRSSMLTVVRQIYSAGGVGGLQAGLQMAVVRESSKAFFRIGAFQPILDQLHDRSLGPPPVYKRMAYGCFAACSFLFFLSFIQGGCSSVSSVAFHFCVVVFLLTFSSRLTPFLFRLSSSKVLGCFLGLWDHSYVTVLLSIFK